MPIPPSPENYYTGGHTVILGGVDLGNIDDISVNPEVALLDHFTRRTGKRVLDKQAVVGSRLTITATLDEHAMQLYRFYFMGTPDGLKIPVLANPLVETNVVVQYVREGGTIWTYSHTRAVTRPAGAIGFGDGTDWAKYQVEIEALLDINATDKMGAITFAA